MRMAPLWEGGALPNDYLIQGVVEMAVTNLDRIDFYVLIGGQDDREVTLWRDAELEADVLEALTEFWGFVERDEMPPITGSRKLRDYLAGQVKRKAVIEATPADMVLLERWRELARQAKAIKRDEDEIRNHVLAILVERDGNKLAAALGDITLGNKKNTRWKDVAADLFAVRDTLERLDRELGALRVGAPDTIIKRIDVLRAGLEIAHGVGTPAEIVARHTTTGKPSPRRPNHWTANPDDEDTDE
jgi:predicted phage-related endonuclease